MRKYNRKGRLVIKDIGYGDAFFGYDQESHIGREMTQEQYDSSSFVGNIATIYPWYEENGLEKADWRSGRFGPRNTTYAYVLIGQE